MRTASPTHCSNCGRENPDAPDGYTACCNEPVCGGEDYGDTYATGTFPPGAVTGTADGGSVRGCCNHTAELAAQAKGVHVVWRN